MGESQELFICQRCGYCCHGDTTVSLDKNDVERMVNQLGLKKKEVFQKYLRKNKNVVQMQIVNGHCVFYRDGCKVHEGRPWRCAQWPLHPSILIDKSNLETIKASCPGVNRKLSYEGFCQKLQSHLTKDKD